MQKYGLRAVKLPPVNTIVKFGKQGIMQKFNSIWDVTPETAHPRARHLITQPIIWNYGDDDSPLGNDTGPDTFAAYLDFRSNQAVGGIQDFIREELALRGIPDADWDSLDLGPLEQALNGDRGFAVLMHDDFIIGLAFAQLLVEGGLDPNVRQHAVTALNRQGTDVVLSFRGGGGEEARKKQLADFRRILELV
jgi:uncharacterized protein YfeS